jgi:adenylate cyclase
VKARLDLKVSDLGATQLKNILEPVRVYGLQVGLAAQAKPSAAVEVKSGEKPPARLALPDKPSIAVLPFQNMSDDPSQDYFVDGRAEDIIAGLSQIKWLFVIARNSSFTYKGKAVDVRQVGRELGVRYVLEGGARKAGVRLRITAQLIEAETGAHLWAEVRRRARGPLFCQHRWPQRREACRLVTCYRSWKMLVSLPWRR